MRSDERSGGNSRRVVARATRPETAGEAAETLKFYRVSEVAAMLRMSSVTLYRAISAGEFPAVRVRGRLVVPAKAITVMAEAAIANRTVVDASSVVVPDEVA